MKFISFIILLIVLLNCSVNRETIIGKQQNDHVPNPQLTLRTGLKIEYGPNLGITHTDTLGNKHFYVHCTATITNDSTIPIQLQLSLANEYDFPAFCNDNQYKAFLLPEELTPDTATLYNNLVNGQHGFLNIPLVNPSVHNKILKPGEYSVLTIGILTLQPNNCAAVPRAILSHDDIRLYRVCDPLNNEAVSTQSQLELGVKLEYYYKRKFIAPEDGCAIIPIGQISYPIQ